MELASTISIPVGKEELCVHLLKLEQEGKLHHAYLFLGPPHIGKTAVIQYFIDHVHLAEVFSLTPLTDENGKKSRSIGIEQVRDVLTSLSHSSMAEGIRVVIVNKASDLTHEAANALLKKLEEAPPRTIFFLCAADRSSVLPTIGSRCHAIYFPLVAAKELERAFGSDMQAFEEIVCGRPGIASLCAATVTRQETLQTYGKIKNLLTSSLEKVIGTCSSLRVEDLEFVELALHSSLRSVMHDSQETERYVRLYEKTLAAREYLKSSLPLERVWESLFI